MNVSKNQMRYLMHWLRIVIVAEVIMLILNQYLPVIYLVIATLFFGGFCLRVLKRYPGEPEPLILDFSGVLIALIYGLFSLALGMSMLRFLLILTSSLIIMPHIVFIVLKK
jgi:hypothetical protein